MTASPFSLAEKTVLVCGASSGIGRQTCISISQMGGTVIATGRDQSKLDETLSQLSGTGHQTISADLVDADQRAQLVEKLPKLNGFVYSAGISRVTPLKYISDDLMDEVMGINFDAPSKLTRALLKSRLILPEGAIVYVGSIAPMLGIPGQCAYTASKAGLMALGKVLAMEVAPQEIRVNSVAPAMVKTPIIGGGPFSQEQYEKDEKTAYPFGYGEPEDVANAIVFLLSRASKWITGTTLLMDGGLTCR